MNQNLSKVELNNKNPNIGLPKYESDDVSVVKNISQHFSIEFDYSLNGSYGEGIIPAEIIKIEIEDYRNSKASCSSRSSLKHNLSPHCINGGYLVIATFKINNKTTEFFACTDNLENIQKGDFSLNFVELLSHSSVSTFVKKLSRLQIACFGFNGIDEEVSKAVKNLVLLKN